MLTLLKAASIMFKMQVSLLNGVLFFVFINYSTSTFWDELNFEPSLLSWHIGSSKELRQHCINDPECPLSPSELEVKRCFGFEPGCAFGPDIFSYNFSKCLSKVQWQGVQNQAEQKATFWSQADFGSLAPRLNSMRVICSSKDEKEGSYLECSDHLRICKAKNIYFDFKSFDRKRSQRYRNDIIHEGEVGGKCSNFNKDLLLARADEKSYLQSWGHELEHFTSHENFKVNKNHCDIIFDRPTIIMKLDASVNMYHHFCDFINLYASQFINGSFSQDVDLFWWDTHYGGFNDAFFGDTWKAFTNRVPVELVNYAGKKVCFRNALFPLLARQRRGLFYNMPLIGGCQGTGIFSAFTRHLLHRLHIKQNGPVLNKVRITLLQRDSLARKINNINELQDALAELPDVHVEVVNYNDKMPFLTQIETTHNSDIFIGMHGAGLTHLLFLPDWAVIFELYNCGDEYCYLDLARLRGVNYRTWNKKDGVYPEGVGRHPQLGTPHEKFTNYAFDVLEFVRRVKDMIEYVRRHPQFVKEQRKLRRKEKSEL